MKKIIMAVMAAATLLFTGCETDETVLVNGATTAGSLTMLTWFSIDNPDPQVKTVLKDVVKYITTTSVAVTEGKNYMEAFLPAVQEIALKQDKLSDYQKTLISAGAIVILSGIDTYLDTHDKVKANADLVGKVVAGFGKGCQTVLNMSGDCPEGQCIDRAIKARSFKCRGGQFVAETLIESKKTEVKPAK